MIVRDGLHYNLVAKEIQDSHELIAIRIGEITVIGLYIRIHVDVPELIERALNRIRMLGRGRCLVVGDFNSRHHEWCTKTTRRGRILFSWKQKFGWTVTAPTSPTFWNCYGSPTTIDLSLSCAVDIQSVAVPSGQWQGASDHQPIIVVANLKNAIQEMEGSPISKTARQKLCFQERATPHLEELVPKMAASLKEVNSKAQLQENYEKLVKGILLPWEGARRPPKSRRYRFFWTDRLDKLAKVRSQAYRKAMKTRDPDHLQEYKRLDKAVKKGARKAKRESYTHYMRDICDASNAERSISISACLKAKEGISRRNMPSTRRIQAKDFTEFISNQFAPIGGIENTNTTFDLHDEWRATIRHAINLAPKSKATGGDEIFAEAFQLVPAKAADMLFELWAACGRTGSIPKEWKEVRLFPLYKKGDMGKPENYRPIALLSHSRKIIEKAIDMRLRLEYTFEDAQCGFQPMRSTETALIRAHIAHRTNRKSAVILDLKSAYQTVIRAKLLERVESKLSRDLASMIALMLSDNTLKTVGDTSHRVGRIVRGVVQGSPLSPSLFNIYVDTLIERTRASELLNKVTITLFADDIICFAQDAQTLQLFLDICSSWGTEYGLTWAVNKCALLLSKEEQSFKLKLCGKNIKVMDKAEYLGIGLAYGRTDEYRAQERIRSASQRLTQLRRSFRKTSIPMRIRNEMVRIFILPMITYALNVQDMQEELESAANKLINSTVRWMTGAIRPKLVRRAKAALEIFSIRTWRWIDMIRLRNRLRISATEEKESTKVESAAKELEEFENRFKKDLDIDEEERERKSWKEEELKVAKRRQLAVIQGVRGPWLDLPTATHVNLAWNFFCGRFPDKSVDYETFYGVDRFRHWKSILDRKLGASCWTTEDRKLIIETMDNMCDHWPTALRYKK